jgi:hypothetical protein
MKEQTRIQNIIDIHKIHLTSHSSRTLLFCCRAAAIAFAPSSPIRLFTCKTHVGPHAPRRKSRREFSHSKRTTKFILQVPASVRCCSVAERRQSPSLPRRRLGCSSAKLMLALMHRDQNNNINLTMLRVFTRLISPVLMRAANATQSASETLQSCALISSLSTSNSLLPNFTFGMEL